MEWISVNDRLPEVKYGWSEEDVLILTVHRYVIGRTSNGNWVDMKNEPIKDVTHWQKLPKPPIQNN